MPSTRRLFQFSLDTGEPSAVRCGVTEEFGSVTDIRCSAEVKHTATRNVCGMTNLVLFYSTVGFYDLFKTHSSSAFRTAWHAGIFESFISNRALYCQRVFLNHSSPRRSRFRDRGRGI